MIGWLRAKAAAKYCGVGERTVRSWLRNDGLKYSKIRGTVLIKVDWLDEFLSSHQVQNNKLDQLVEEISKEVLK